MPVPAPIRYVATVEQVDVQEAETIKGLNEAFDMILERTAKESGHAIRSVHAKSHGLLQGELTIEPGLPPELAQGMFATAGKHKAFIRMSTNAGDILPDTVSLPRGFALKILDVTGERLPDADGTTQDFIMVNGPVFQAPTAEKFLGNLTMLAKTTNRVEGLKVATSATLRGIHNALETIGVTSSTVDSLGGAPNVEPLGETYYSTTPFRYGDYIAKFSVKPVATTMTALTGKKIAVDGRADAIREEIQTEMRESDAEWEFRVQLCRDLEKQPVEDSTVEWKEEEAPWMKVATLRAKAQDSWSSEHVQQINEGMRFSVWTGLLDHQPLGNINRARKAPYRHSADFRASFNGCPYHEPTVGD